MQNIFPLTFPPSCWEDIQVLKDELPAMVTRTLGISEEGKDPVLTISRKYPQIADDIDDVVQAWIDLVSANEHDEPEDQLTILRKRAHARSADLQKLVQETANGKMKTG